MQFMFQWRRQPTFAPCGKQQVLGTPRSALGGHGRITWMTNARTRRNANSAFALSLCTFDQTWSNNVNASMPLVNPYSIHSWKGALSNHSTNCIAEPSSCSVERHYGRFWGLSSKHSRGKIHLCPLKAKVSLVVLEWQNVWETVSTVTAPLLRRQFCRPLVLILEDDVWLEDRCVCELGGVSLDATPALYCSGDLRMISSWSSVIYFETRRMAPNCE